MNETGVPTYTVPYYMAGQTVAPAYPLELEIRYPKVSQTNPTVTFHLLQLSTLSVSSIAHDSFAAEDLIIGEVAWVADAHENVLFRAFNRVQDREKLVLVDVAAGTSKVVRERDGTDGWLDNSMSIQYVGALDSGGGEKYYIDLSDHTGWPHLYLFSVAGSVPVRALTKGEWAVAAIVKIDVVRGLVYYLSTERHSTERHLYSVSLLTGRKTALVDTGKDGYWAASFSSGGGYYILSYNGPNLPYQHLYSVDSRTPLATLNDNAALETKLSAYRLPTTRYHVLRHPSGYSLNAREILPPNFNPQKKYPVLFDPYGGPGSQDVSKAYLPASWRHYIASDPELEYIVVTVDGRGTGYQGRKFRTSVVKQLGRLEAEDQVWAGRLWRAKSYVDGDHMAMWGWSFGGYLTAKVVELDSGVFSLGLITAPVSGIFTPPPPPFFLFSSAGTNKKRKKNNRLALLRLDIHGALHENAGDEPSRLQRVGGGEARGLQEHPRQRPDPARHRRRQRALPALGRARRHADARPRAPAEAGRPVVLRQ